MPRRSGLQQKPVIPVLCLFLGVSSFAGLRCSKTAPVDHNIPILQQHNGTWRSCLLLPKALPIYEGPAHHMAIATASAIASAMQFNFQRAQFKRTSLFIKALEYVHNFAWVLSWITEPNKCRRQNWDVKRDSKCRGSLVAALLQLLDQRDSNSKENLTIIILPTKRTRSTLATEKIR